MTRRLRLWITAVLSIAAVALMTGPSLAVQAGVTPTPTHPPLAGLTATGGDYPATAKPGKPGRDPSGAFVYRNGVYHPLGAIPGTFQPPGAGTTHAAINNRGELSGSYIDAGAVPGPTGTVPIGTVHAFVENARGTVTKFDVPRGADPLAQGINNRGQAAGTYIDAGTTANPDGTLPANVVHGFVRQPNGKITTFNVPFPYLHAVRDINDRGAMVGYYDNPDNYLRLGGGFLREPNGKITRIDVPGALPSTSPFSINNRGQIAGWYADAGTRLTPDGAIPPHTVHGFLLDHGRYRTLDAPRSLLTQAYGINERGQIVGVYYDTTGTPHGFLLDKGRYTALDAPGQPYTFAQGINDHGDVLITEPGAGFIPVATP
jgi:probable HAF family extracellular repeat protein